VTQWVLGDFAKADREWLEPVLDAIARTVPSMLNHDLGRFMTDFNQHVAPPENGHKKSKPQSTSADGKPPRTGGKTASGSSDTSNRGSSSAHSGETPEPPKNAMAEALMRLVTRNKDE
jgi:PTH1 family peptidyl-tRNA hydrolase